MGSAFLQVDEVYDEGNEEVKEVQQQEEVKEVQEQEEVKEVQEQEEDMIISGIFAEIKSIPEKLQRDLGLCFEMIDKCNYNEKQTIEYFNQNYFPKQQCIIPKGNSLFCEICQNKYPKSECYALKCHHYFCKNCYTEYALTQIEEKGLDSVFSKCPQIECKYQLTINNYRDLLLKNNKNSYEKYKIYLHNRMIQKSKLFEYCPGKGCNYIIQHYKPKSNQQQFNCQCPGCKASFCLSCYGQAHRPLSCDLYKKWIRIFKSGTANEMFIKAYVETCPNPNCDLVIIKEGGCMQMTCSSCKYEFCWLCKKNWKQYHTQETGGYYSCNQYQPELNQEKIQAKHNKAKLDFYSKRHTKHYRNIQFSQKEAIKKYNKLLKNVPSKRLKFFEHFMQTLLLGHQILAWSFVIGFFLSQEEKIQQFNAFQFQLEDNLWMIEQKIFKYNLNYLIDEQKQLNENEFKSFQKIVNGQDHQLEKKIINFSKNAELPTDFEICINDESFQIINDQVYSVYWSCNICTLINDISKEQCEVCENQKGVQIFRNE